MLLLNSLFRQVVQPRGLVPALLTLAVLIAFPSSSRAANRFAALFRSFDTGLVLVR